MRIEKHQRAWISLVTALGHLSSVSHPFYLRFTPLRTAPWILPMERRPPLALNTHTDSPSGSLRKASNSCLWLQHFLINQARRIAAYAFFGFLFFLPISLTSRPVPGRVSICSTQSLEHQFLRRGSIANRPLAKLMLLLLSGSSPFFYTLCMPPVSLLLSFSMSALLSCHNVAPPPIANRKTTPARKECGCKYNVPGGRLCLILSALLASFSFSV